MLKYLKLPSSLCLLSAWICTVNVFGEICMICVDHQGFHFFICLFWAYIWDSPLLPSWIPEHGAKLLCSTTGTRRVRVRRCCEIWMLGLQFSPQVEQILCLPSLTPFLWSSIRPRINYIRIRMHDVICFPPRKFWNSAL